MRTVTADGPAVVWVRLGNTGRRALIERLAHVLPLVEQPLDAGDRLVEVA